MDCRQALKLILDQVDYTATPAACGVTDLVGAVLPRAVIDTCRAAIAEDDRKRAEAEGQGSLGLRLDQA